MRQSLALWIKRTVRKSSFWNTPIVISVNPLGVCACNDELPGVGGGQTATTADPTVHHSFHYRFLTWHIATSRPKIVTGRRRGHAFSKNLLVTIFWPSEVLSWSLLYACLDIPPHRFSEVLVTEGVPTPPPILPYFGAWRHISQSLCHDYWTNLLAMLLLYVRKHYHHTVTMPGWG